MQRKFRSFVILFLFLSSVSFSQDNSCRTTHCLKGDRGYFGFTVGPGIPVGNFADNNISNNNAGYATTGSKMELNAGYLVYKSIDLAAKLFYSSNSYDVSPLTRKLAADYPGISWTTSGRSWDIYGFLVGVNYSYPFTRKLVGDFKFQSGFISASTPQMLVNGSDGSKITEGKKSASSFAVLLSAGGHYPLGRLIDLVGNLEYVGSSPTFSNINKVSNITGFSPVTSTASYTQNIGLVSLNFGFRVKF